MPCRTSTCGSRMCAANAAHPLDIRIASRSGRRRAIWLITTAHSRLREPVAGAPFVLGEQHPAKLCEGVRPDIVERTQDVLAVIDGECDDSSLECERLSRNERVGSSTSVMSSRTSSSGTCKPARYTKAKVSPKRATPNRRRRFQAESPLERR